MKKEHINREKLTELVKKSLQNYKSSSMKEDLDLGESLHEIRVDYDFSKEELIRVIKQLKRGASTEIGMIKAFEKALGRELTDDEIRGFKLNESKTPKTK